MIFFCESCENKVKVKKKKSREKKKRLKITNQTFCNQKEVEAEEEK